MGRVSPNRHDGEEDKQWRITPGPSKRTSMGAQYRSISTKRPTITSRSWAKTGRLARCCTAPTGSRSAALIGFRLTLAERSIFRTVLIAGLAKLHYRAG